MGKRRIYIDKAEMVLIVPGKKGTSNYNLKSTDISRIQIQNCTEYILGFIPVESEKIVIETSKISTPITYTRKDNQDLFDDYKEEITQYAKENRVQLTDETEDDEE